VSLQHLVFTADSFFSSLYSVYNILLFTVLIRLPAQMLI